MKVLIVCRSKNEIIAPYIVRQEESLRKLDIKTEYFLVLNKDWKGYFSHLFDLRKKINQFKPDIIHAHYGFSGLLTVLQRKTPVITTFHGSDINYPFALFLSKITIRLSAWSIFVSSELANKADAKNYYSIIPCGIDLELFYPLQKNEARQMTGWEPNEKVILFSSSSANLVKNYPLAITAVRQFNDLNPTKPPARLYELTGYPQEKVNILLNACDIALLTSKSEGSPNFIKEAMACNRPIVSTNVGDVGSLMEDIPGCFIAQDNPDDIADKIRQAFHFEHSFGARQRLIDRRLEINETAAKIVRVYEMVLRIK